MLRVRRVRVYIDGGALLLPVDRHVLATTSASTRATDAAAASGKPTRVPAIPITAASAFAVPTTSIAASALATSIASGRVFKQEQPARRARRVVCQRNERRGGTRPHLGVGHTSAVTDMSGTDYRVVPFLGDCRGTFNEPIGSWDVAQVTSMGLMFYVRPGRCRIAPPHTRASAALPAARHQCTPHMRA